MSIALGRSSINNLPLQCVISLPLINTYKDNFGFLWGSLGTLTDRSQDKEYERKMEGVYTFIFLLLFLKDVNALLLLLFYMLLCTTLCVFLEHKNESFIQHILNYSFYICCRYLAITATPQTIRFKGGKYSTSFI